MTTFARPSDEPMYVHIAKGSLQFETRPTLLLDGAAHMTIYHNKEPRQFQARSKDLAAMRRTAVPQRKIKELACSPPPTIHESPHESDGSTNEGGSDESQTASSFPTSVTEGTPGARSQVSGSPRSAGDQRVTSRREKTTKAPLLQGPRTTITLTGLPSYFTRKMLMVLLDSEGFERGYDLLYVPMDFEKQHSLGYALINLTSIQVAERCFAHFSTFEVTVAWSSSLQGLIPCVEKYRNSPIMHDNVPDDMKPALFVEGKRIAFPKPTMEIPNPIMKQINAAC